MSPFFTQCVIKLCKSLSFTQNRHKFHKTTDLRSWHKKSLQDCGAGKHVLYLRKILNCSIPGNWEQKQTSVCFPPVFPKHPLHLARDFTITGACRNLNIWELRGMLSSPLGWQYIVPACTYFYLEAVTFSLLRRTLLNVRLPSTVIFQFRGTANT